MTVALDWQIEFDEAEIRHVMGAAVSRILARAGGRESWHEALTEARDLVRPAAAWVPVPIVEIRQESVFLAGGSSLNGGPVATVVAGASDLIMAVCTVGEAIDRRIKELQKARHLLTGVLLDELGTWAVDVLRQQLCRRLRGEATAAGLRVSTSLSPGESEWSLADQAVIFSALDAAQIGVSLSPSLVMHPLKSLSLIMGRGSRPLGREGGSHCDYCARRDRCTYRCRRETA
ncbi:MAG TPA: hypothetical protein VMU36_12060 [Spirochaetia bacterium]|nr:hypothetical protein [Spirochaetia bacterium]